MVNVDLRSAITRTTSRVLLVAAATAVAAGLAAAAPASAAPATPDHEVLTATASTELPAFKTSTIAAAKSEATTEAKAAAPVEAAPARSELTSGTSAAQQRFTPNEEQLKNAEAIIEAGQKMGTPPRAWVIAVATALQESTLNNLGHLGDRNDHDSQGLFQQRPSAGWGTVEQITDPEYATTAFLKGLMQVDGWENMPLTAAAQTVQVSAFPDHYAKWEQMATDLVLGHFGEGPYAQK